MAKVNDSGFQHHRGETADVLPLEISQTQGNISGYSPFAANSSNASKDVYDGAGNAYGSSAEPNTTNGTYMKQANGSRVILHPDGSVEIIAKGGPLTVEAGDDLIIKSAGSGSLDYKGDLNISATGNITLKADGSISKMAGHNILESSVNGTKTSIHKSASEHVNESKTTQVGRTYSVMTYEGFSHTNKGPYNLITNGDMKMNAGRLASITGDEMMNLASTRMNVVSQKGNFISGIGTIGGFNTCFQGRNIVLHGSAIAKTMGVATTLYAGDIVAKYCMRAPTFHGDLNGVAKFAIVARRARPCPSCWTPDRKNITVKSVPIDGKSISRMTRGGRSHADRQRITNPNTHRRSGASTRATPYYQNNQAASSEIEA